MRMEVRLGIALLLAATALGARATAAEADDPTVFAVVDGTVISTGEFSAALQAGVRQKYYHGKVPEQEIPGFQREIGTRLIQRVLLLEEAKRRGVEPDASWVAPQFDRFEGRYREHAGEVTPQERERVLGAVRAQLEAESRIRSLEQAVRDAVAPPAEKRVREYYEANPDKFTEPERFRVSAILLKVDPSSPSEVWNAALEEARGIVAKLREGADFGQLARLHSADSSAENDGDMGYLHRGMLGGPAQAVVDEAAIGEITDPVRLLEGVAIFRVDERPERRLRGYDEVRERAAELLLREQRDSAWSGLIERLEGQAEIHVNEQHYLPMPG